MTTCIAVLCVISVLAGVITIRAMNDKSAERRYLNEHPSMSKDRLFVRKSLTILFSIIPPFSIFMLAYIIYSIAMTYRYKRHMNKIHKIMNGIKN
jgi:flagellar biosynthesis component FlhA